MADPQLTPAGEPAASEPVRSPPVLDSAHIGDIQGALGTIRLDDVPSSSSRKAQLIALLAIIGPGLIVMVGDNDAGGVATYAEAGQNYGSSLLWVLLLLIPVLIVNQEMVVRLGAVTGVGHGRLILERFGRFWGAFSVFDLFVLNFLTIVTEFIGVDLALSYFGVSRNISVPIAGIALVAMTSTGSFRKWERLMFIFVAGNLLLIPLAVYAHSSLSMMAHDFVVPGVAGGVDSTSVLLIIALVGTTVAPWQLFFQQSNIVDKRITTRWINYERVDTVLGSFIVVISAALLIAATAFPFAHTALHGQFTDALGAARGLQHTLGYGAGLLFALVLLNASIIGAGAVTLSTSYAFGDVFGLHHSLHRPFREAKFFYGTFAVLVGLACSIVLIPGAPLGVITVAVQALAGVLLPSASVFLLILCNDKEVLGPWVNKPWLNVLASLILGVLLMLSAILVGTTLFPSVNVTRLLIALSAILVVACGGFAVWTYRGLRRAAPAPEPAGVRRQTWTMPPLALLAKPEWSRGRIVAMYTLRGYLVVAVGLLLVKAIELAGG
jgi:Mn2+/Fe2+ NRAMP family transporter